MKRFTSLISQQRVALALYASSPVSSASAFQSLNLLTKPPLPSSMGSMVPISSSSCRSFLAGLEQHTYTRFFSGGDGAPAARSQKIGFIGLGNMGSHMAANLLSAGHHVYVLDRTADAMHALAVKGALLAKTPLDIAEKTDVIITMLPASSHVQEVYVGSNGLLTGTGELRPSLLIDCSTVDPQTSRLLEAKVAARKLTGNSIKFGASTPIMLDAPVSGGVGGAQAGTLTFMVGGSKEGLAAALPLFNAMGKSVVHCGGPGNGAAAKLCNNLAMGISMAGVSEAYALGQQLGIDALTLTKIFNSSSARCWSSDTYNPVPGVMAGVPASRDYKGGFSCQLLMKDLGLALKAAQDGSTNVPLTEKVHELYTALCEEGHGQQDFSSIFLHKYKGQPFKKSSEDEEKIERTT